MPAAIDPTQAQKHGQVYELAVRNKFKEILAVVNAEGSHVGESDRAGADSMPQARFRRISLIARRDIYYTRICRRYGSTFEHQRNLYRPY